MTPEDFWLFQGLSEGASLTGESCVTGLLWGYLFSAKSLIFLLVSWTKKPKTVQSPTYTACVYRKRWCGLAAICYKHNLQFYLQMQIKTRTTFPVRVSADPFVLQDMLNEELGVRGFLARIWKCACTEISSSWDDLHLLKCARCCLWLAAFQELWRCFWCVVLGYAAPGEEFLLQKCLWLCPSQSFIGEDSAKGLWGPKYRALKC